MRLDSGGGSSLCKRLIAYLRTHAYLSLSTVISTIFGGEAAGLGPNQDMRRGLLGAAWL